MRLDQRQRICITPKAVTTADHFLLCRHFDYHQIAYHKTVAALEYLLQAVLRELVKVGSIEASAEHVRRSIAQGDWREFDDIDVFAQIRDLGRSAQDPAVKQMASAIVNRTPPKMVASVEFFGERRDQHRYDAQRQLMKRCVESLAQESGIDPRLWHVWHQRPLLTKIGSQVPLSAMAESSPDDYDDLEQSIRVLDPRDLSSMPIMQRENSLTSILADQSLFMIRVYVLLPPDYPELAATIRERLTAELGS